MTAVINQTCLCNGNVYCIVSNYSFLLIRFYQKKIIVDYPIETIFQQQSIAYRHNLWQGCQLPRIERESHAWTLFITLSRQACKISCMNAKHLAKHVKSHASRKGWPFLSSSFFACHYFFKAKTDTQFEGCSGKKNCKILKYHVFALCFRSSRQAILKSWQPCLWCDHMYV